MVGTLKQSGRFEQKKILTSPPRIETGFLDFPASNVVKYATGDLSTKLYGVTSQEAIMFMVTAVKNLNNTNQIIYFRYKVMQIAY